ncbi:MAG TPA: TlyA family RNA methyltransferase [Rhizomicrobium sp.]|nr:TlyA family RNA methyltransferase [Rhizomicrobium sp.]
MTDSTPFDRGRRADVFLVERGFAASRAEAQAAIAAGQVRADGVTVAKPAQLLTETMHVDYAPPHTYVSRGALKLIAALDEFSISPEGLVCLDIGASAGGFTEVLLERGAHKVFAVDVGHGQLREKLAKDPRVVVMEGVNARSLTAVSLPQAPQLIVADVSFISLKLALSPALALAKPGARLVALVKPQFEVGRARLGKGGIVKSEADRRAACEDIQAWLVQEQKWLVEGTMESPIAGGDGNREFLVAAQKP